MCFPSKTSRMREEMLVVFVSVTLFMAVIVSLSFASILVNKIENETRDHLFTNVRVLDFAVDRLQKEGLAKTKLLASRNDIKSALLENNFTQLDLLLKKLLEEENLGFLSVLDGSGAVVLRAHAPTQKNENLSDEQVVGLALGGTPQVTVGESEVEGFSIRATAPIYDKDIVVGVILAGFPLDNILADNIKNITGLEVSIFEETTRVATTLFNPDGRTRTVGILQTDPNILQSAFENRQGITTRTTVLSRPFIASYIPLFDVDGRVVGMLSAAKPQADILETAKSTNRLTLVVVISIMLLLILPLYRITRRLAGEAHNSTL